MAERFFPGVGPVLPGRGLVASSFQYYLTGDESLRVETLNTLGPSDVPVVDVGVRLWREDDRAIIVERERHVGNFLTLSRADYALPAGALLNLRLSTASALVVYGNLFVRAQLIRGAGPSADVIGTLTQGYLSPQNDRAWPGSPIESMHDSLGVVTFANFVFVAGPSLSLPVPAGVRWRLMSGHFDFQAFAAGVNRELFVVIADAVGNRVWVGANGVICAPGNAAGVAFGAGVAPSAIVSLGQSHLPLPVDLDLSAGMTLQITVGNANINDLFLGSRVMVRQWMDT
jgi:hypothetical protein